MRSSREYGAGFTFQTRTNLRKINPAPFILFGILGSACGTVAADFPAGLTSPDHGVVCNSRSGACFDRFGPSIGLTEAFLGPGWAHALTATLRDTPPDRGPGAEFSPGENVTCRRETGPCRIGGVVDEALTAVLYGPRPAGARRAEASTVIGVDWQWLASRYNNDIKHSAATLAQQRSSSCGRGDCFLISNMTPAPWSSDGSEPASQTT